MSEVPVDIVIAGAGPNGLMLATELCLAGLRPIVLEGAAQVGDEPRANALVGQVVQMLHMRGLYKAFTKQEMAPEPAPSYFFGGFVLPFDEVEDHSLYTMYISQPRFTRQLAERAQSLGTEIRWGHELVDLVQRDGRVLITVMGPEGPYEIDAGWLVGSDGGKSTVRKKLGIGFPGHVSDIVARMGHVALPPSLMTDEGIMVPGGELLPFGYHRRGTGMIAFRHTDPGLLAIAVEFNPNHEPDPAPMTFRELHVSIERILGTALPVMPPEGAGPYALKRSDGQQSRLAERYRAGNVFLLGDAAHVHFSMGGPGLNLGLQDAVNLGWKLAMEIKGEAPADLLDTYHSERYPVGERVMMQTLAQTALLRPGPEMTALGILFGELLKKTENIAHIADLLAGTDVLYDVGDPHPMCGRMVRDFPLTVDGQESSVFQLLHKARPVLLDLTADGEISAIAKGWEDRVDVVVGKSADIPADALLVRPDGYIAWVADGPRPDYEALLRRALNRWVGPARR